MTIIKDSRTGYYKGRVKTQDGSTKTLSTHTQNKAEAQRVLRRSHLPEIEEAAKAGRLTAEGLSHIIAGKRIVWSQALIAYEQALVRRQSPMYVRTTVLSLANFARVAGVTNQPVTAVTEEMCDKFINARDERKLGWRRNQRSDMVQFFKFLSDKGWILGNPAKLARVNMNELSHEQKEKKQRQPFTDEQITKLLKDTEPGEFWHTAIAIARYTGLRLGDVAMIEWDSFAVAGKIIVWTDKKDKRVALDIHPNLQRAIDSVPPNGTKYMFPDEREVAMDPARRANLSTYFRRVCHASGIETHTFHDLRSAYCTDCFKRGIEIEHIAQNVGHTYTATTRGYIK